MTTHAAIGMSVLVLLTITVVLAVAAGASALFALIFMLLWNAVAVPLFGAPTLSFLMSWGLWLLLTLIGGCFKAVTR